MLHALSEEEQRLEARYESIPFEKYSYETTTDVADEAHIGIHPGEASRETKQSETIDAIAVWTLTLICGIVIGAVSSGVHIVVSKLSEIRLEIINDALQDSHIGGVLVAIGLTTALTAIASVGWFIDTSQAGSGLPELIAFFNGVDTSDILKISSTALTTLGTIAISSSGMAVGYEGEYLVV